MDPIAHSGPGGEGDERGGEGAVVSPLTPHSPNSPPDYRGIGTWHSDYRYIGVLGIAKCAILGIDSPFWVLARSGIPTHTQDPNLPSALILP